MGVVGFVKVLGFFGFLRVYGFRVRVGIFLLISLDFLIMFLDLDGGRGGL